MTSEGITHSVLVLVFSLSVFFLHRLRKDNSETTNSNNDKKIERNSRRESSEFRQDIESTRATLHHSTRDQSRGGRFQVVVFA